MKNVKENRKEVEISCESALSLKEALKDVE
jgi:hypothetical protein